MEYINRDKETLNFEGIIDYEWLNTIEELGDLDEALSELKWYDSKYNEIKEQGIIKLIDKQDHEYIIKDMKVKIYDYQVFLLRETFINRKLDKDFYQKKIMEYINIMDSLKEELKQLDILRLIKVGTGVTIHMYSDRKVGTIQKLTKKAFYFTYDEAERIDNNGISDVQEYKYTENKEGKLIKAYMDKEGKFRVQGSGNYIGIGYRKAYYDYSF